MPSASYKTMTVGTADRTVSTSYSATIKGLQDVSIFPQVSGLITEIRISEGDRVHKGQTLFVIDQVPYKAALLTALANVESAEAAVATAQMDTDSKEQLYRDSIVSDFDLRKSRNTLAQQKAALSQAKAQLTQARDDLSYTEVKSPVNGTAGMIPYRIGALVGPSITTPLVSVSDNTSIYAYFSLSETTVLHMSRNNANKFIGTEVELQLSDGSLYPHKGKIDAVSGIIDASTGAVQVRARFSNADNLLRSGGSANVIIPTERRNCIVIPQEATWEIQEKVFVYSIIDGKTKSTEVTVYPISDGKEYIVESGLNVGDVIVAEGAGLAQEGVPVATQTKE